MMSLLKRPSLSEGGGAWIHVSPEWHRFSPAYVPLSGFSKLCYRHFHSFVYKAYTLYSQNALKAKLILRFRLIFLSYSECFIAKLWAFYLPSWHFAINLIISICRQDKMVCYIYPIRKPFLVTQIHVLLLFLLLFCFLYKHYRKDRNVLQAF